jgi:hypothetical protein
MTSPRHLSRKHGARAGRSRFPVGENHRQGRSEGIKPVPFRFPTFTWLLSFLPPLDFSGVLAFDPLQRLCEAREPVSLPRSHLGATMSPL